MSPMQADAWQDGDLYEPYVGRWSRVVASQFVDWLDVRPGGRWLDVGCGTGALSETVLVRAEPREVHGVDQSEGFVKYAMQHLDDPRFEAQVGDARSLPFDDVSFDAVVSGLVLNFIADQGGVAKELVRVAAPGATVAVYVSDYAGGMQMMRYFWDAAKDMDPAAREQDEGERFQELASLKGLGGLFELAGLSDVRSRSIDSRRSSGTSTTTGGPSSRARDRHRRIARRSTKASAPSCASCSASGCPRRRTGPSASPPARGPSRGIGRSTTNGFRYPTAPPPQAS